jgi:hypothetical protein
MTTINTTMKSSAEWAKEGWEKRNTYDEPRLSELKGYYEELGYEVMSLPFNPAEEPGCTACMASMPEQYRTLYTRKLP